MSQTALRTFQLQEARYGVLLQALPTGVMFCDRKGEIRFHNQRFVEFFPFHERILGCKVGRFTPFLLADLAEDIRKLLEQGTAFNRELVCVDRWCNALPCVLRALPVPGPDIAVREFLWLVHDRAERVPDEEERRRLRRQLKRGQRMESFGLLAAGIAHDLNNLLSCIMGSAEILLATTEAEHPNARLAAQVAEAAEKGGEMTRKVLHFSRLEDDVRQPVDVNLAAKDVLVLLRRSIDPRIEIEMDLAADRSTVFGVPAMLHQILMNLGVNARDSMPQGGILRVGSRRIVEEGFEWLLLEVQDTGCGIAEHMREKIFEPFFTTKSDDRGTGLGLSTVRQAAQELGGRVELHSEVDVGTNFQLYLPLMRELPPRPGLKAEERVLLEGQGRILIVDDNAVVRETNAEMLEHLGYEVDRAENGVEALEIYGKEPQVYGLIILDLMMPRMDGLETLRRMLKIRPEQAVLVITGYANDNILGDLKQISEVPVMLKPFRFDELSRVVSSLVS